MYNHVFKIDLWFNCDHSSCNKTLAMRCWFLLVIAVRYIHPFGEAATRRPTDTPLKCLNKLSPSIWAYLWIQDFFILENCPDKLLPSLGAYLWIQVHLNFVTAIWYQHQTFTGTLMLLGRSRTGKRVLYLRNQDQMNGPQRTACLAKGYATNQ